MAPSLWFFLPPDQDRARTGSPSIADVVAQAFDCAQPYLVFAPRGRRRASCDQAPATRQIGRNRRNNRHNSDALRPPRVVEVDAGNKTGAQWNDGTK